MGAGGYICHRAARVNGTKLYLAVTATASLRHGAPILTPAPIPDSPSTYRLLPRARHSPESRVLGPFYALSLTHLPHHIQQQQALQHHSDTMLRFRLQL